MKTPERVRTRQDLLYLLTQAAELEHSLCCQYLFAAFTLKEQGEEGVTDAQAAVIQRWGEVLARPVSAQADGYAVTLDEGRVIFVSIDRERAVKGEGIIGMELATDHAPGVLEAARECGLPVEDNMLQLAGVDFRLVR